MIDILDKKDCCGCSACVQRCPKHCISMVEDEEGFLYPKVDLSLCIDCGLCEKVCPVINQTALSEPLEVYAATNPNEEIRLQSSSGGIFSILARKIINEGGVVFGARFDQNWQVEHGYAENFEELGRLLRSKYVQSNIGDSFKQAESFLKVGKSVLFVGVPCHIAGLKKYLRKNYSNLLTVDIVCHGVPSPMIWRDYLTSLNIPEIVSINFRAKQTEGFCWKGYGLVIKDNSGQNVVAQTTANNLFLSGFSKNLFLRPSCHNCPAKYGKSGSDMTLGDFWGIWNKYPELDDNKGVSMVLINSEQGRKIVGELDLNLSLSSFEDATKGNPMLCKSTPMPVQRQIFWEQYQTDGINCILPIVKSMQPSFASRIINKVKLIFT